MDKGAAMLSEEEDEEMVFLKKQIDSFTESGHTAYIVLMSKDRKLVKHASNFDLLERPEPLGECIFSLSSFFWHKIFKISGFINYLSKSGEITIIKNGKVQGSVSDVSRN